MNVRIKSLSLIAALVLLPSVSWAQIIYEPASGGASIPTLSASMLIFLGALLLVVTKWVGFKRGSTAGKTLGMLVVCAVASGAFSLKLISDVYADGGPGGTTLAFLDSASGGSVPIDEDALNIFENTSGTVQRIVEINLTSCPDYNAGIIDGVSRCTENAVISIGEDGLCYTDCRPLPD